MRGELVAIDLETSGLDPALDSIIEFGGVRLRDGKITEEYSTLIDPGHPIPANITHLTGITTEDVAGAPNIETVLPLIRDFVGDAPVIAHNVAFDISFLQRYGLLKTNQQVDTYDLASVLMPRAPRYNLNSLTSNAGIELENAHRALDDARAAALLYWYLWNRAIALPRSILKEISVDGHALNWGTGRVFEAALGEVESGNGEHGTVLDLLPDDLFDIPQDNIVPLRMADHRRPLDSAAIAAMLDDGGNLASSMEGFERREPQIMMIASIAEAFNAGQHLIIEAGTGTGKSLAYLLPAIFWATTNGERVVISTDTINLQEQLINKDIPALRSLLNVDFSAAIMKGRGNYLCPRRLASIRRRGPTSGEELRTLAKILVWLLESQSGDRGEISLRGTAEHMTWQRLSAEDEGCTMERCATTMRGRCPFYRARKAAEAAHLLIVNHALLIADAASDSAVLPDYRYLIVDEAHQLEEAITRGTGFRMDEAILQRRISDLGGLNRGLLGDLLRSARDSLPDKDIMRLEAFIQSINDAAGDMRRQIENLFRTITAFLEDVEAAQSVEHAIQVRITSQHRARDSFVQIQASWNRLDEYFEVISEAMQHLTEALRRMSDGKLLRGEELISSTSAAARYLTDIRSQLDGFFNAPDSNTIYWLNIGSDPKQPTLQTAPLHVGPLMEQYIWHKKETVVLTGATLQTSNTFDFVRERLFAEGISETNVGSPFDYKESTLLFVPDDIPEPNDRQGHQRALERGIIELAAALGGRVLALFTSFAQLRQTAQAITPRLALGDITVYAQSDGSSRQSLLDSFKSTDRSVLLGTRSFWQGIDVPGDSLSALVIARLPFTVPSDPVFAARSETYNNSFNEYAVPDAILRFRQGFGRLIRTKTDRGIVAVFDSRILTKSYGTQFLESLPECTVQYGPLDTLPGTAQDWLGRK